ncbi:MAG: NAD-binding protein [Desulfobacteraceae bacterium]|jgi:voltage-gated potassium channel
MDSTKLFVLTITLFIIMVVFGTIGYMVIEGWDSFDALYMTIITLATVGYSEIHELSSTGRLFTMVLIVVGVGFFVYTAGTVIQFMVDGRIQIILGRRRLENKIKRLKNHYIICGYGRIGRVLCQKLIRTPLDLVVIENDTAMLSSLEEDKMLYICGDATDESVLLQAGIERAKGLIAVLATDTDNVFLILTARQLAPNIHITARAGEEASRTKLWAAGANTVESPYEMGATSMAQRIIRPTVTNFLDLALAQTREDIQMEEIPVNEFSNLQNVMLKDSGIRQKYNLIIIAIKKPDGSMHFNPSFETSIQAGDTVIAVGEAANLQRLETILNPHPINLHKNQ